MYVSVYILRSVAGYCSRVHNLHGTTVALHPNSCFVQMLQGYFCLHHEYQAYSVVTMDAALQTIHHLFQMTSRHLSIDTIESWGKGHRCKFRYIYHVLYIKKRCGS